MVLTVQVDNAIAKENLLRLAASLGYAAYAQGEGEDLRVVITKEPGDIDDGQAVAGEDCRLPRERGDLAVFITTDTLGRGSDELGRLLMKSFLYGLTEWEELPATLALMNGGVKLAVRQAATLTDLQALTAAGTQILVCGTCLDFFGLKDELAVGQISNMYDIQAALLAAGRLLQP